MVEIHTACYILLGLLIEVAYRVLDYMLFKVNNLKGEMDEEE